MTDRKKIFRYPGSKTKVVPEIIGYLPKNYADMCWVDAFGGSGIVSYYKKESKLEVFNDLDEGISAIFYCLLFKFEELIWRLRWEQHSEVILRWINKPTHLNEHSSVVDKAISKLYQLRYTFGGKVPNNAPSFTKNVDYFETKSFDTYFRILDLDIWLKWQKRFKSFQIMGRTAVRVIKSFDTKDMIVYCDPPYIVSEKGKHYQINFTEEDHIELAETLKGIEGKFLLSYDDKPLIHELYADYNIIDFMIPYSLASKERTLKKELLIANYPLEKQKKLEEFIK